MSKGARPDDTETTLFVRGIDRDVLARVKAAAALNHQSLADHIRELLRSHVQELERQGVLPKPKP